MAADDPPPRLITYKELSAARGITRATLRQWLRRGRIPPPDYRVGNSPAWLEDTVRHLLEDPNT